MRLPAGGVLGIQFPLLVCLDVACVAVARNCFAAFGYGDQHLGQMTGVSQDLLDHGLEMGSITGLVADPPPPR